MSWEMIESRVDWITATSRTTGSGNELVLLGSDISAIAQREGGAPRDAGFQGYFGRICGSSYYGWRADGTIVRLGGELAKRFWRDVVGAADNVSRFDCAITYSNETAGRNVAREQWENIPNKRGTNGHPVEYTLILTKLGGQTLYVGSRASDKFGRLYDKGYESKHTYPVGSWRYEVEYKGAVARSVAHSLLKSQSEEQAIWALVYARFHQWEIFCPGEAPALDWRDKSVYKQTTNESRFKWLQDNVSKTIERLSGDYTEGELRLALGLEFTNVRSLHPNVIERSPIADELRRFYEADKDEGKIH